MYRTCRRSPPPRVRPISAKTLTRIRAVSQPSSKYRIGRSRSPGRFQSHREVAKPDMVVDDLGPVCPRLSDRPVAIRARPFVRYVPAGKSVPTAHVPSSIVGLGGGGGGVVDRGWARSLPGVSLSWCRRSDENPAQAETRRRTRQRW